MRCGGCANTLKKALTPTFPDIEIDILEKSITLTLENEEQKTLLNETLLSLGYPLAENTLDFVDNATAKAKSVVSCMIGKFSKEENS